MNIEQNLNIDTIPSGWSIQRVKEIACWQTGFTPDTKKPEYYDGHDEWITIGDLDGKIVKSSKNKIDGSFFPKNWLTPANSLLFSFKLSIGQVAFNEKEVYTNEAICSFSPKSKINLKYFYYAAPYFIVKNANKNIYGADLLNQELIANALLMVPPKEQQEKIANYLDIETSKIDRKISILEQKFDKLEEYKQSVIFETVTKGLDKNVEMKDSEIDWIGKIPAHWEISRVKDVFNIGRGRVIAATEVEKEQTELNKYPVYSAATENNGIIGYINTFDFNQPLLTWTTDGAKAGTVFIRDGEFNCTNVCGTLIAKDKQKSLKFYKYALEVQTPYYKRADINGAKIMNNEMAAILIAEPTTKNEKIAIVSYLDEIFLKINKKTNIIKKQIELLKEYKQTIIYEAVTGKVEIL